MESQNPPQSPAQTIGSLTQAIVKNAADSAMTSPSSLTSFETTTSRAAQNSSVGTQLSTLGSVTLRDLAVAAVEGKTGAISDSNLRTLLESHFKSRLDVKTRTSYGTEETPDFKTSGYQVTICLDDGDEKVLKYIQAMNRPAKAEFTSGKLARMRVMLARRGESDRDVTILLDTMMDICGKYPADAIADVTDHWLRTQKFFPKASEFLELLEEKVMLRRAVLAAMEPKSLKLAPPARPKTYKEVAKPYWDGPMWTAYIADAKAMLALAEKTPAMLDVEGWKKEVARRIEMVPKNMVAAAGIEPTTSGL